MGFVPPPNPGTSPRAVEEFRLWLAQRERERRINTALLIVAGVGVLLIATARVAEYIWEAL